ncbi:SOLUTE CARRIER FAMILY 25 MEMBER 38 [Ceraceosorus bombacis]|uniref:SOLUTE CARRIER FAMILY 25 MEMBER 38 n=1 Tax=Ceraceosorus bombacis TaxID=401625 RepID=A0A0P1BD46_9BASI|nr:SOLUTE CARRIER FAMILY 25 MEMBER 38 [Ceraceosorus bombacis]
MKYARAGLIAGTAATLLTHPFDILKTRLQTTPRSAISVKANASAAALGNNTAPQRSASTTLISLTREMLSKEGAGAFLDGLGLRCARKAASSAIGTISNLKLVRAYVLDEASMGAKGFICFS